MAEHRWQCREAMEQIWCIECDEDLAACISCERCRLCLAPECPGTPRRRLTDEEVAQIWKEAWELSRDLLSPDYKEEG